MRALVTAFIATGRAAAVAPGEGEASDVLLSRKWGARTPPPLFPFSLPPSAKPVLRQLIGNPVINMSAGHSNPLSLILILLV